MGKAYNIQSAFGVTNIEVAVRMLELFGYSPKDDFHHRLVWIADRPFNDQDYRVDGSKLDALGWRQHVPLAEGLKRSVDWYRENVYNWWPELMCTFDGNRLKNGFEGEETDEEVSGNSSPVMVS